MQLVFVLYAQILQLHAHYHSAKHAVHDNYTVAHRLDDS